MITIGEQDSPTHLNILILVLSHLATFNIYSWIHVGLYFDLNTITLTFLLSIILLTPCMTFQPYLYKIFNYPDL